jgi:hypothetical protein
MAKNGTKKRSQINNRKTRVSKTLSQKIMLKKSKSGRSTSAKLWITIIIVSIVLLVVAQLIVSTSNKLARQNDMAQYLRGKYGKEFVVENYRIEGRGIGVEGDPTADAYLKSDKDSVRFEVWDYGDPNGSSHQYRDNYINQLWSREYLDEIKPEIKAILYDDVAYEVAVYFNSSKAGKIDYKHIPSFQEYRSAGNKEHISIELIVFDMSIRDSNRLWKLVSLLQKTSLDSLYLRTCDTSYKNCRRFSEGSVNKIHSEVDIKKYLDGNMKGTNNGNY